MYDVYKAILGRKNVEHEENELYRISGSRRHNPAFIPAHLHPPVLERPRKVKRKHGGSGANVRRAETRPMPGGPLSNAQAKGNTLANDINKKAPSKPVGYMGTQTPTTVGDTTTVSARVTGQHQTSRSSVGITPSTRARKEKNKHGISISNPHSGQLSVSSNAYEMGHRKIKVETPIQLRTGEKQKNTNKIKDTSVNAQSRTVQSAVTNKVNQAHEHTDNTITSEKQIHRSNAPSQRKIDIASSGNLRHNVAVPSRPGKANSITVSKHKIMPTTSKLPGKKMRKHSAIKISNKQTQVTHASLNDKRTGTSGRTHNIHISKTKPVSSSSLEKPSTEVHGLGPRPLTGTKHNVLEHGDAGMKHKSRSSMTIKDVKKPEHVPYKGGKHIGSVGTVHQKLTGATDKLHNRTVPHNKHTGRAGVTYLRQTVRKFIAESQQHGNTTAGSRDKLGRLYKLMSHLVTAMSNVTKQSRQSSTGRSQHKLNTDQSTMNQSHVPPKSTDIESGLAVENKPGSAGTHLNNSIKQDKAVTPHVDHRHSSIVAKHKGEQLSQGGYSTVSASESVSREFSTGVVHPHVLTRPTSSHGRASGNQASNENGHGVHKLKNVRHKGGKHVGRVGTVHPKVTHTKDKTPDRRVIHKFSTAANIIKMSNRQTSEPSFAAAGKGKKHTITAHDSRHMSMKHDTTKPFKQGAGKRQTHAEILNEMTDTPNGTQARQHGVSISDKAGHHSIINRLGNKGTVTLRKGLNMKKIITKKDGIGRAFKNSITHNTRGVTKSKMDTANTRRKASNIGGTGIEDGLVNGGGLVSNVAQANRLSHKREKQTKRRGITHLKQTVRTLLAASQRHGNNTAGSKDRLGRLYKLMSHLVSAMSNVTKQNRPSSTGRTTTTQNELIADQSSNNQHPVSVKAADINKTRLGAANKHGSTRTHRDNGIKQDKAVKLHEDHRQSSTVAKHSSGQEGEQLRQSGQATARVSKSVSRDMSTGVVHPPAVTMPTPSRGGSSGNLASNENGHGENVHTIGNTSRSGERGNGARVYTHGNGVHRRQSKPKETVVADRQFRKTYKSSKVGYNKHGQGSRVEKHNFTRLGLQGGSVKEARPCKLSAACGSDMYTYLSECYIPAGFTKLCDGFCPCPKPPATVPSTETPPAATRPDIVQQQYATSQEPPDMWAWLVGPDPHPASADPTHNNHASVGKDMVETPYFQSHSGKDAVDAPRGQSQTQPQYPRSDNVDTPRGQSQNYSQYSRVERPCAERCPMYYRPVCTVYGSTFDNECLQKCSGEPVKCEGPCPCEQERGQIKGDYCNCNAREYNPVCTDEGEQLNNECVAVCRGKAVACSSHCPC